ncbi:HPF/RaiA family ribosome-associated protein [Nocardia otitidiscaviarum]|uniref:HPF/RaiA family ribosome-associated protein n=1 Tax=Nocardia otitidiscaviarum TaxID=1823 RepID=UPI0024585FD6|nr:HPF/RaiA family ribosome-associated protein [Nocardia otitidiscaviarum]
MEILVNTGRAVEGDQGLLDAARERIADVLGRFGDRITRVEVYLSDENGDKGGEDDKKCTLEARPAGQGPVVVTHKAATIEQAYDGAAREMVSLLSSRFGRQRDVKGGESIRHIPAE